MPKLVWYGNSLDSGSISHDGLFTIDQGRLAQLRVGVAKALFIHFSIAENLYNEKYKLVPMNHGHIWQVSLQLSCRDTCQIWPWHSIDVQCFDDIEILENDWMEEIDLVLPPLDPHKDCNFFLQNKIHTPKLHVIFILLYIKPCFIMGPNCWYDSKCYHMCECWCHVSCPTWAWHFQVWWAILLSSSQYSWLSPSCAIKLKYSKIPIWLYFFRVTLLIYENLLIWAETNRPSNDWVEGYGQERFYVQFPTLLYCEHCPDVHDVVYKPPMCQISPSISGLLTKLGLMTVIMTARCW